MAARRVIVKRLAAIHDLGGMDVLCTDKTGTLTEARIRLVRHLDPQGEESERVLQLAYLNSAFESGLKSPLDEAILAHGKVDVAGWRKIDEVPFDFERRRVSVLVEGEGAAPAGRQGRAGGRAAPLHLATRPGPARCARWTTAARAGAPGALRASWARRASGVLGIACRAVGPDHASAAVGDEAELVFAGFAVFLDPPKASAAGAVRALAAAGRRRSRS